MLTICLLVLVAILSLAVIVLFRQRMVDLSKWHSFTHELASKTAIDFAAFKSYVEAHIHLHTAPPASAPVATTVAKK